MWLKWLPWKLAIRKASQSHGFLDPWPLLARLRAIAQPSEVAEPVELLRAGVVMHARGLINSRVIQHNLDWIWPFWVESQFDPASESFVPRAFSLTHINLTHRNWTAAGLPDFDSLPLVDPRGLVTPHHDGWSIDAWIVPQEGDPLFPSRTKEEECRQRLDFSNGLEVVTNIVRGDLALESKVSVKEDQRCIMHLVARSERAANLVVSLRPYNPEGVSVLHSVALDKERREWLTDSGQRIRFSTTPHTHHVSDYHRGDVAIHLDDLTDETSGNCEVGMLTAAALFQIPSGEPLELDVSIPLENKSHARPGKWNDALAGSASLRVPDPDMQELYDSALRTLILCSPDDVFPGSYTYKRFWFRDAAFMIYALLQAGLIERADRAVRNFFHRQKHTGYFHSQDGEWDSNGQALWAMDQLCRFQGEAPPREWAQSICDAARWIMKKRIRQADGSAHQGLLPAGFSAEHLGPNDYYYWDDFWSVSGLRSAARMCRQFGKTQESATFEAEAMDLTEAIQRSLHLACARNKQQGMPAAPYRRMDAGAIGSIVTGYPLKLAEAQSPELMATVDFLMDHCSFRKAFFQDMVHSGVNPYLTLHLAQILMRAGDSRYRVLRDAIASLATSTGQWPEAVHPRTGGGCMGDGQHAWAAAEWISLMRHSFVREEGDELVLGSGVDPSWLEGSESFGIQMAPTHFGEFDLSFEPAGAVCHLSWKPRWHTPPARVILALPGRPPTELKDGGGTMKILPQSSTP